MNKSLVCKGIGAKKRNKEKKIMIYRLTMHLKLFGESNGGGDINL